MNTILLPTKKKKRRSKEKEGRKEEKTSNMKQKNTRRSQPGASIHGIFQAEYWSGFLLPSPKYCQKKIKHLEIREKKS